MTSLAILPALRSTVRLTPREIVVLRLIADGKTYVEIGRILGISPHTVDSYSLHLHQKTQVNSAVLLTRWAIKEGYVDA